MPKWTSRAVKDRMLEAVSTLRRLRQCGRIRPDGYRSSWPDVIHKVHESYGYDSADIRGAMPTPREIDRMDESFEWLTLISDIDQRRLILARAFRTRWAALRPRFGMLSIRRLQQLHDKGIAEITLKLNRVDVGRLKLAPKSKAESG